MKKGREQAGFAVHLTFALVSIVLLTLRQRNIRSELPSLTVGSCLPTGSAEAEPLAAHTRHKPSKIFGPETIRAVAR